MKSNSQLFPTTSMVLFCSWITLPTSSSPLKVVPVSVIFPSEQLPAQLSSPKDATGSVWCEKWNSPSTLMGRLLLAVKKEDPEGLPLQICKSQRLELQPAAS